MSIKSLISLFFSFVLFSSTAFGDCDFKDLVHNANGTVTYSAADHICVGQLVQDNATKAKQIADYTQALTLKDLVITKSDQRTQVWMDTTFKLEDNINKIDSYKSTSNWIFFGLGALTIIGAGVAAAQVSHIGR